MRYSRLLLYCSVLFFLLLSFCTDNGVDNSINQVDSKDYYNNTCVILCNDTIEYQTNEYVRIKWEDIVSRYVVQIIDAESNNTVWDIKTSDNFLEFPKCLSEKEFTSFDTSATYYLKVWGYKYTNEIYVDSSKLISISADEDFNPIDTVDKNVLCIFGSDCKDSTDLDSLNLDISKLTIIDTVFNYKGVGLSSADTLDLIDTFFVFAPTSLGVKVSKEYPFGDTLTAYSFVDTSVTSFSFKYLLEPSAKIDSIKFDTTSECSLFVTGDSNITYSVIVEDLLNDSTSKFELSGNTGYISFTYMKNTVYRFSAVARINELDGNVDSIYAYGNSSLLLPYRYFSTFEEPLLLEDSTLIPVAGGFFLMGDIWNLSLSSLSPGTKPVHGVVLSSYYMNENEVTVGEYLTFINSMILDSLDSVVVNPVDSALYLNNIKIAFINKSSWVVNFTTDTLGNVLSYNADSLLNDNPIMSLTWGGAALYCNWLSSLDSTLTECYAYNEIVVAMDTISYWSYDSGANGYRLPSEAEWEFVASQAGDESKEIFYNGSAFKNLSSGAREWVNDVGDLVYGTYNDSSAYYYSSLQNGIVVDPCNRDRDRVGNIARGATDKALDYENYSIYRLISPNAARGDIGFRLARNK